MKEDNILNEIEEWLDKVARSFGTIPLSDIPTWRDFDEIYMGRVPRSNSPYHKRVLDKPYWHKYDIPFEMAYSDYKNIHHMIDNEIELDIDYGVAIECFERYRNVVVGFTNDKKLDNIENEIQEWLEETARSYGTIPPSKEVNWHDIEQVNHGYVPRDGDRKLDNKPHWDKYDISFESAFVDSVDITHMSTETLEGDFDTLIHLVKRYRNIVLSDEIASEYKKEEKKLPQVKNKNISSEDQYRVFCMFSQLSKEETKGYDCDEMWSYCHDLYSTFCDSEFNDDDMSEIDAMNNFLENIEERIAWCKDNPPLTNGQKLRLRIIQNYLDFKSGYGDPDCKTLTDDCLFDYISWDIGRGDSNYIDKDGNDRFPELNNDEFSNVTLLLEDKEVSHV